MKVNIIDTHIHIWDLERSAYEWLQGTPELLKRSYSIDEIEKDRQEAGVVAGVLVQADNTLEDTDLMLETARSKNWIKGVVGWVPLLEPEQTQRLLEERFLREKYFLGVRHLIHDEKDPEWLLQPRVIESLKILAANNIPYDVVGVLPVHIKTVLKVAEKVPELKMVLDHINQPPIASGEKFGVWGELMEAASQHQNLHIKISGLSVTAGRDIFSAENIKPYLGFALQQFGVSRCFCGGDWPVALLGGEYVPTWEIYKAVLGRLLMANEQNDVFYNNAVSFYGLDMN